MFDWFWWAFGGGLLPFILPHVLDWFGHASGGGP